MVVQLDVNVAGSRTRGWRAGSARMHREVYIKDALGVGMDALEYRLHSAQLS
jgi:hypothetical protein